MRIPEPIEHLGRAATLLISFILIGIIGFFDYLTGYEIAFAIFYLLPLAYVTWLLSRWHGVAAALASTLAWFLADLASGHTYSHPFIPFWNCGIRLVFFLLTTWLLAALKDSLQREKELASTDYLTGAANSRFFYELLQLEIDRLHRFKASPFTLVYIDLDNFKTVNDRFGHKAGDQLLRSVAETAKGCLRKIDILARLGGDEFTLLLPETGPEAAPTAVEKLVDGLTAEVRQHDWPISFSIGVVTCIAAPPSADELVHMADIGMYSVKNAGKNAVAYQTYAG